MGAPIHQNCLFPWKIWTSHVTRDAFGPSPLPSNRHHGSNGDCLEGKVEIIRSVLCNIVCNNCAPVSYTHLTLPTILRV